MKECRIAVMKKCPHCGETKQFGEFYKNKGRSNGLDSICKKCRSFYNVNQARKTKKIMYGITRGEYNSRISSQRRQCSICHAEKKLYFDHNRKTLKFRGLICHKCNTGLGSFNDEENIVRAALNYLHQND